MRHVDAALEHHRAVGQEERQTDELGRLLHEGLNGRSEARTP